MEKDGSPHRHHPEQPRRKKVPAADFSHRMVSRPWGLETHRDVCQNVKSNDDQGMAANRMVPSMLSYEAHRDLCHDTDRFDDDEISGRNLLPIRTGREIQQNLQCEAGINDQYTNSQNLATRLWENEAQHQSYYFPLRDSDDMVTSQMCAPARPYWAKEFGQQFDVAQNRPNDDLNEKMSRFDAIVKTFTNEKDFSDPAHSNDDEMRSLPCDQPRKGTTNKRTLSADNICVENKTGMVADGRVFYHAEPLHRNIFTAAVIDAVRDSYVVEPGRTFPKVVENDENLRHISIPHGIGVGNGGRVIQPSSTSDPMATLESVACMSRPMARDTGICPNDVNDAAGCVDNEYNGQREIHDPYRPTHAEHGIDNVPMPPIPAHRRAAIMTNETNHDVVRGRFGSSELDSRHVPSIQFQSDRHVVQPRPEPRHVSTMETQAFPCDIVSDTVAPGCDRSMPLLTPEDGLIRPIYHGTMPTASYHGGSYKSPMPRKINEQRVDGGCLCEAAPANKVQHETVQLTGS